MSPECVTSFFNKLRSNHLAVTKQPTGELAKMCHTSPGVQPGDLFDGLEADYDIHLYSICMGILFQTSNMGTLGTLILF